MRRSRERFAVRIAAPGSPAHLRQVMVSPTRLRLSHRSIAALLSALLLFSWTGEALGFYPCPHHSWRAVAVASPAHDHAAGSHAAGSRLHGATTPGEHSHHGPCTCLGDCAAGATYPAAPSTPTALA